MHAGLNFCYTAHMFSHIIRQLNTFPPFLIVIHFTFGKFHNDI